VNYKLIQISLCLIKVFYIKQDFHPKKCGILKLLIFKELLSLIQKRVKTMERSRSGLIRKS
jgi:hypothetical protein